MSFTRYASGDQRDGVCFLRIMPCTTIARLSSGTVMEYLRYHPVAELFNVGMSLLIFPFLIHRGDLYRSILVISNILIMSGYGTLLDRYLLAEDLGCRIKTCSEQTVGSSVNGWIVS